MQIVINIDSQADREAAIALLSSMGVTTSHIPDPAPAAPKAAAPKPAAPKAAAPKPAAPKAEPVEEDLLGGDDPVALKEQATTMATALVTTGGSAKVRAALSEQGVKRVSELEGDAIAAFIAALA